MERWAKIIDEEKMTCDVGIGTDNESYRQQGYRFMDVEQADNGMWYVKGYAPMSDYPSEVELKIEEIKKELSKYDYIGVKIATGCATIEEYSNEIALCERLRKQIRILKGEIVPEEEGAV